MLSNTGKLDDTMSVSDLKKDHSSILRNPDIANICYIRGYIEMLGTGTLRMIADCEDNNYPAPEWEPKGDRLELTLMGISHRITNDGVNSIIDDGVSDGVINGVSDGVREGVVRIINILLKSEGLNAEGIVKSIPTKSKSTIERYVKIARELDMIVYKGAAKTGGYFLTEKMRKNR
ncbi:MAG: hypothetical protein PF444_07210 [Bacteroidales bacterium]|nr:hypothetical protein [Bacteroidales bacterium]